MAQRTRKQKKAAAANRAARAKVAKMKRRTGEKKKAFQARQQKAYGRAGGSAT